MLLFVFWEGGLDDWIVCVSIAFVCQIFWLHYGSIVYMYFLWAITLFRTYSLHNKPNFEFSHACLHQLRWPMTYDLWPVTKMRNTEYRFWSTGSNLETIIANNDSFFKNATLHNFLYWKYYPATTTSILTNPFPFPFFNFKEESCHQQLNLVLLELVDSQLVLAATVMLPSKMTWVRIWIRIPSI